MVEFADRLDRRAEQLGVMRFPPIAGPSQERASWLIHRVEPVYPPLARQARIQGVVRVSLVIGQDGHVRRTQLVAGHPLLAGAAMEAVRQWVYQPVLQSGEPVEVTTRVDVPFVLESPPAVGPAGQAVQQQPGVMRIRVGGNVQASKLASRVDPEYPPLARQARIQGVVRFSATIDRDGGIANLQLVSGHPLLVAAAQEAVSRWRYQPTLLNGQPVEVVTQIDMPFTLP